MEYAAAFRSVIAHGLCELKRPESYSGQTVTRNCSQQSKVGNAITLCWISGLSREMNTENNLQNRGDKAPLKMLCSPNGQENDYNYRQTMVYKNQNGFILKSCIIFRCSEVYTRFIEYTRVHTTELRGVSCISVKMSVTVLGNSPPNESF